MTTPEPPSNTGDCLPRPYYEDDAVTIYHGDCREVLRGLAGVRLFVTSPPYNTLRGRNKGARIGQGGEGSYSHGLAQKFDRVGYVDHLDPAEYDEFIRQVAAACAGAATGDASLVINLKLHYRLSEPLHPWPLVTTLPPWLVRQEIVWDRGVSMSFGSKMFPPSDERWYWLVRDRSAYEWVQPSQHLMSVVRIPPERVDRGHPCPFPEAWPEAFISRLSAADDLVVDPFMGSGTTLAAARRLGRRAIGIDKDERYCEVAASRVVSESLGIEEAS